MTEPIIEVKNLTISYMSNQSKVTVFKNINFQVYAGERVVLLGPSGEGKSTLINFLMGVLPDNMMIESGSYYFLNEAVYESGKYQPIIKTMRGREIGLIMQDAMLTLNPNRKVIDIFREVARQHVICSESQIEKKLSVYYHF
ncbi:hypothetical protein AWM75_08085 [Aerococcus urinaehominis]|uniref:Uncharacterized protein n=1 Tax=Aerococcus urinaehominis TaxID=128944 RepID=A0A0X8FMC9_9LACT|nr:ATP-binding cassette domain-containing protein [Aerococcus urinaehominis]AMB99930.1 hypothetical protein AWM75_08085 [Aerococcus urinaehominis]SDM43028.1 ABC transporter [Aerococcus urinaehominis]